MCTHPHFPNSQALAEEHKNLKCFKVDVDENADAAQAAGISAMPTFQFYKGGRKVCVV